MNKKQMLKINNGITLIALVITIIILIILAGVSINLIFNEDGILEKTKYAAKEYEIAEVKEQIQMDIVAKQLENNGNITDDLLKTVLEKYGTINYEEDGTIIKSITTTKNNYEILLKDIWTGTTIEGDGNNLVIVADGSWNGTVNTPKIKGTGLTAVYWNEETSKWVDLSSESSQEEWDNWYNYADTSTTGAGTSNWANARSKDGSMWVWIPRYEYKIDEANKTIDVRFIPTSTNTTTEGYTVDGTTGIVKSSDNYILHPAFMNDRANTFSNGGWDKDLPGFWVAKYEAGFQNATVGEETKTVQYSNLKYTTIGSTTNFLGEITVNTTSISYPVFKANTYTYNSISVADAWLLSQEIDTVSMYGLSNVDSHMLKNSEWGAIAYLTHSKYGVNGKATAMNEIAINSKNLNNSIYVNNATSGTKANVYAVTSYGNSNDSNDINASSTKNMTGIFDLNGGAWERVAGFMQGGKSSETIIYHNAMADATSIESTKYLTLYTANNKVGDVTNETAGWNSDYAGFIVSSHPSFLYGGSYDFGVGSGVFASSNTTGGPAYHISFRVCLTF